MNIFADTTVIDTETTHLDLNLAEICEVASACFNGFQWETIDSFYGTKDPISFKASAKNHISRRMLEGKPLFLENIDETKKVLSYDAIYFVAHNSAYDKAVLEKTFAKHNMVFDRKWICTMRMAEKLYKDIMELKNLSYLRYLLDLNIPDTIVAHRAKDDVIVTCALFEQIVADAIEAGYVDPALDIPLMEQIYNWCWAPKPVEVFPFGKHKGEKLSEVPTDYYIWAIENMEALKSTSDLYDVDLAHAITVALESRLNPAS